MSYYSDLDDLQGLDDEVNGGARIIRGRIKAKPVSICVGCPKEADCHMNNGVRQACNYKEAFTQG